MRRAADRSTTWLEALEMRRLLSAVVGPLPFLPVESATAAAVDARAATVVTATAAPLDAIVFGNTTSESAHGFSSVNSQTFTGMSQTARRLLPLNPVQVNGGEMTFTLAVDPVQRNYFTVKLWGSDDTDQGMGRLYLYVSDNGSNYQVGYRHEGDYAPLSVTAGKAPLPGRFFYSTTLLPLAMTAGKTSLTLKIISTGELYGLGSGGPPSGNYQFNMDTSSRGIYRAYTHTQPLLYVTGETQGAAPPITTRPASNESAILGPSGTFTNGLNNWINGRLGAAFTAFTATDVEMLARSYSISQLSAGYQNPAIVSKVIAVIDGFATHYYANPTTSVNSNNYGGNGGNEVWGGRFGALGWAIHMLATPIQPSLDTLVNYGSAGGNKTRRQAWGDMLAASRDWGRFNRNSRYLTNQTLIADSKIYQANRGLLALGDPRAFAEAEAQRYLKESIGLLPWLGSDLPGGGSALKYGDNYYQVTDKGLTREWGYAGGYSEMASYAATFYEWTGNTDFKNQAVKMVKAAAYMRRPAIEVSGGSNYRSMERIGLLAWRGVREADGYFANEIAYGNQAGWAEGMRVAGVTLDPHAIGYARQMLADNQFLVHLTSDSRFYSNLTFDSRFVMEVYDDYNAVKAAPDSGIRLPMTAGQADFAWADEEAGLIVIKSGDQRLWLEPYWQAKRGTGINGVGRFHFSTTNYDQYGTLETNPQFASNGSYFVRNNNVDMTEQTRYQPPDDPDQAYAGEKLPVGVAPADANNGEPFRGKVFFYAVRFGPYLVGINRSANESFELKTPAGFTSATDLASGTIKSGVITVAPASSIVLKLAEDCDPAPVPIAPLMLTAAGSTTQVTLDWSAASGATSYNVKRATAPGGPYATLSTGLTVTTWADTSVTPGQAYYYVVTATNDNGESYPSTEASASAGLAGGWANSDIGTVALPGNASRIDGLFAVRGSGGDIGGSSDSFHFAYTTVSGDATIIARVASRMNTNDADKVGIMFRESLSPGARRAFAQLTPTGNPTLNYRSSTNGGSTGIGAAGQHDPRWLKLVRSGSTFTGYVSVDGLDWTLIGSTSISMSSSVLAGLAVCSRYSQELHTATFDNTHVAPRAITGTATGDAWFARLSIDQQILELGTGDGAGAAFYSMPLRELPSLAINLGGGSDTLNVLGAAGAGDAISFTASTVQIAGTTINHSNIERLAVDGRGGGDQLMINDTIVELLAPQQLESLEVTGGGTLDVAEHDLVLDYSSLSPVGVWIGSEYDGITGYVASGRVIASAGMAPLTTLAVAEARDVLNITGSQTALFAGHAVDSTAVLIRFTYAGDANLDGKINIDDYGRIDGNVSQSGSVFGYFNGDFNYDGKINIDDYGIIDGNISQQDDAFHLPR